MCAHLFLMAAAAAAAAGVDAARLTLASILSGNFAQTFFTIFLWQSRTEKQQQQIMKTKYEKYELFPTVHNKTFWIWFFSCNLWKFMIYDMICVTLWQHTHTQEEIASVLSIAWTRGSASAVL